MLDIFDLAAPAVADALAGTRHAIWALVAHRMIAPFLFFLVSLGTLAYVRYSIQYTDSRLTKGVCGNGLVMASNVTSIHAYHVPFLNVLLESTDATAVTIVVGGCNALYDHVREQVVTKLFLNGGSWLAAVHPALGGALVLTSHNPSHPLPFPPDNVDTHSIVDGGALVLAFKG